MKNFFVVLPSLFFISLTPGAYAESLNSSKTHTHEKVVDGQKLKIDSDLFNSFVRELPRSQIAIVSVNGMVCDFCARGIEKTFRKDVALKKIDVDLSQGKLLLAYSINKEIIPEEIGHRIMVNGQNMTGLQVITVN